MGRSSPASENTMCSELEMKNRLNQECYARSCQEIEELKRRCYQEENEVTQQKMNEYTMQHDQESRTMSPAGSSSKVTRTIGVY